MDDNQLLNQNLIKEFLNYLKIKGKSPNTLISYKHTLKIFNNWIGDILIEQITRAKLTEYQVYLGELKPKNKINLSLNSQSHYLIALRSFLKYLQQQDHKINIRPEMIELPKINDREITFLDKSELKRLLKSPFKHKTKLIIKLRNKAILELLFSTGLRLRELTSLNKEQINFEQREITVKGKGGKIRLVFLSENAIDSLKNYLEAREDDHHALFVCHNKNIIARLSPRAVQLLVEKCAKLAKITKQVTPHTLRRSFAVDLLNNGCNIYFVQKLLGHSSISTTERYLTVSNNFLKENYNKFHNRKLTPKCKKDIL